MPRSRIHLLVIDPQMDFMDLPGSALPVPGANDDMNRLAAMVDRIGGKLADIHVTLDSHQVVDVGHPAMWRGADGTPPPPFTAISSDDIKSGIWTPREPHAKPWGSQGETILQYMIRYAQTLERQGNYPLMVWPTHCLIGSPGAAVHPGLGASLGEWARRKFATVDFVTKGTNPWTEHYGAFQAEVPMPSDPGTALRTDLLDDLGQADMVILAGEAFTHCLKSSVQQIIDYIDPALVSKFHLLTDATSSIPAPPGGPDFPAIAQAWQDDMVSRGMNLTTTTEFLA